MVLYLCSMSILVLFPYHKNNELSVPYHFLHWEIHFVCLDLIVYIYNFLNQCYQGSLMKLMRNIYISLHHLWAVWLTATDKSEYSCTFCCIPSFCIQSWAQKVVLCRIFSQTLRLSSSELFKQDIT